MIDEPPGAVRAALQGLVLALKAPGLVLAIVLITMISAVPFVLTIEPAIMNSLALQPPVSPISAAEIDAEWWQEFRRQATGLAATFTPAVLGFAAPLDTVSALLDGTRQPIALALPIGLSALIWAFLWGGIINRFATGVTSPSLFMAASSRHFVRMTAITVMAAVVNIVLYLTVHALLFGPVYGAIASRVGTERDAFAARVILYLVFGAVLVVVNAALSMARVYSVSERDYSLAAAVARGWAFVRTHFTTVAGLYLIFLVIFAVAMAGYGAAELIGGSRVGGWRAVAVGQLFIIVRLGLRLALGASLVRLVVPGRQ